MKLRNFCFTTLILYAATLISIAQITQTEHQALARALNVGNFTIEDLGFEKRVFTDKYRLPIVDRALIDPLGAADDLLRFQNALSTEENAFPNTWSTVNKLTHSMMYPDEQIEGVLIQKTLKASDFLRLPEPIREPVQQVVEAVISANTLIKSALSELSVEQQRELIESLPYLATNQENIKFSFSEKSTLTLEQALALLDKVDFKKLRRAADSAGTEFSSAIQKLTTASRNIRNFKDVITLRISGLKIIVSGFGNDVHRETSASVVIDLGGNDTYVGRMGAGVRNCGTVIDLSGDDSYKMDDLSAGAGLLGCGFLFDMGGYDKFFGGSLTFGSGLAGYGFFLKEGGHDMYRSEALSQGFGMFGTGTLTDKRGDDRYHAGFLSQGSSRTQGFGLLVDYDGDDAYTAGGLVSGAPLVPESYICFAQGASYGYRDDTGGYSGGIGLLCDLKGNDNYSGGTYTQGASYWFALGALMDSEGHDTYSAHYYSQSSAMHLCAAYLFDLKGNDAYVVRRGAMHAIGHDYAVAMLLDREGDDTYAGGDSRPGVGNANGVGIFIDSSGNDSYNGPPGVGNPARDSGSIGVFVDISGDDKYRGSFSDGVFMYSGMWAVAYDISQKTNETTTIQQITSRPTPGSKPFPGDIEIQKIYSKATQWGVGTLTEEVEENVNELVAIGLPAFDWMLDKHLHTASRLELRAFEIVMSVLGDDANEKLIHHLQSSKGHAALNAWRLAFSQKVKQAEPYLALGIQNEKTRLTAIRTAGAIKAESSLPQIVKFTDSDDRLLALASVISLTQLDTTDTLPILVKYILDSEAPIRKAALQGIAKYPEHARVIATELLSKPEKQARVGIELLGLIGNEESLGTVAEFLNSPIAGLRIQALISLSGRVPESAKDSYEKLLNDPDPNVRAVANGMIKK